MDELKLVFPDLPYAVEEAMNRLRINVKFCGKNTKKIMLTSCLPNEGKSTVAAISVENACRGRIPECTC